MYRQHAQQIQFLRQTRNTHGGRGAIENKEKEKEKMEFGKRKESEINKSKDR